MYIYIYIQVVTLTDLIVESQSLMRRYAYKQLIKQRMKPEDAEVCIYLSVCLSVYHYIQCIIY